MRAVTPVLALLIGVTGLPVALVARGTAQPPTAPESVPAVTEPEPVPAVAETVSSSPSSMPTTLRDGATRS